MTTHVVASVHTDQSTEIRYKLYPAASSLSEPWVCIDIDYETHLFISDPNVLRRLIKACTAARDDLLSALGDVSKADATQ